MGYVIEQIGGFIRVTLPNGNTRHYLAQDVHVEQRTTDGKVQIWVDNELQECFDYTEVDTPAELNNADLINTINGLITSGLIATGGGVGNATEAKQDAQITLLTSIETKVCGGVETPGYLSTTTSGSVAAGAHTVSIFNNGNADGTVLGTTLPRGLVISFEVSDLNNTLSAIAYDATGTEFLISETR